MIPATAALRAGALSLLEAQGEREAAALVSMADVEIVGPGEPWLMGSRQVTAHRIALVLDPLSYAAAGRAPRLLEAVRAAFGSAMRTPTTELADLSVVLKLPGIAQGWDRAYRDAPRAADAEHPDPGAVLAGAAELAEALAETKVAAMLRRAELESADAAGGAYPPLMRYVLRLDPADLALAKRAPDLADRLRRAVHDAGTRAAEVVATVELGALARGGAPSATGAEARLVRTLAAMGMTVVPVARSRDLEDDEERVTFAVVGEGEVRLVEVMPGSGRAVTRRRAQVTALAVPASELSDDEGARAVAAAVCEGMGSEGMGG